MSLSDADVARIAEAVVARTLSDLGVKPVRRARWRAVDIKNGLARRVLLYRSTT